MMGSTYILEISTVWALAADDGAAITVACQRLREEVRVNCAGHIVQYLFIEERTDADCFGAFSLAGERRTSYGGGLQGLQIY